MRVLSRVRRDTVHQGYLEMDEPTSPDEVVHLSTDTMNETTTATASNFETTVTQIKTDEAGTTSIMGNNYTPVPVSDTPITEHLTIIEKLSSYTQKLDFRLFYGYSWLYSVIWVFMISMCMFLIVQLGIVMSRQLKKKFYPGCTSNSSTKLIRKSMCAVIICNLIMSIVSHIVMLDILTLEHKQTPEYTRVLAISYSIFFFREVYCIILFLMALLAFFIGPYRKRVFAFKGLPFILLFAVPEAILLGALTFGIATSQVSLHIMAFLYIIEYVYHHIFIIAMYIHVYMSIKPLQYQSECMNRVKMVRWVDLKTTSETNIPNMKPDDTSATTTRNLEQND